MRQLDLRSRLLLALGLIALLQVIVGLAVISVTRNHLVDQIDDRLATAMPLDRGRGFTPGPPPPASAQGDRPPPERLGDTYEGLVTEDSLVTFFAPNTTGTELAAPQIDIDQAQAADGNPITVDAAEGNFRYRLTAVSSDTGGFFITAIPLNGVDTTISRLSVVVTVTIIIFSLALALVTWWVLRLGIAPMKRMTESAEAIAAGDLTERIDDIDQRTEAGKLGLALNTMLGQIESSFDERTRAEERLRQFIADASHELRTPVATIRGYAELYQVGGLSDQAELDDAMRRTEQESQRMSRLITDMLNLAKLDRDPTLAAGPVDLTKLVADAAADAQATHPQRSITANYPGEPVTVAGDEDLLRQVLSNLVGNAAVHTDAPAQITIEVTANGSDAIISVVDTGEGMPADVVARITERFYRADPSRSRHQGGSGLGLAIVDSAIAAHHGRLTIDSAPGRGTTMTITLPRMTG